VVGVSAEALDFSGRRCVWGTAGQRNGVPYGV